jgi:protein O-mannosyl-transferase
MGSAAPSLDLSTEDGSAGLSHDSPERGKIKERFYLGTLIAAVVLVYGNSLWNGFTMDDGLYLFQNPQVTTPTLRGMFAPNHYSKVFRPLTFATFALDWLVGHGRSLGFHLMNLLLHAGVVCLLYFVLRRLLASSAHGRFVAFGAALLFAVHPIHTEAVSSIVGRAELLAAGFLLAAWLLHMWDRHVSAVICFVAALLSKESAVVFLPLVLVGDYAQGKLKPYLRYAGITLVTLAYLPLLWKLQGGRFGTGAISKMDNPLASMPAVWRIANALHVGWKYLALQIYPAKLSCDYSFNQIPVYLDVRHTMPWVAVTIVALGAWIWAVKKGRKELALAGGIYLCGFAATSNVMPVGTIMGERLAYFPSAGFCLMVGLVCAALYKRQTALGFGVLLVVAAVLGARTMLRNRDWRDNLTLYSAAVRVVPNSAKMRTNLGYAYLDAGALGLARKELDAALQIYPENPDTLEAYGLLESRTGNYQAAGRMLEAAFYASGRDNPNYDYMAVNLAALYMQTGHIEGALQILDREIAESPGYARAWANRAVIHYKRGETAAARADAETALRLEPDNLQAKNVMQLVGGVSHSSLHR